MIGREKQDLLKKAHMFHKVFSTPDGKAVLEAIRAEGDPELIYVPGDQMMTNINVGKQDLVKYINKLVSIGERVEV